MQTKINLPPSWLMEFLFGARRRRDYNENRAHSSLNQLTRKHFAQSAMKALQVCILHGPAGPGVHQFGLLLNTPSHKIMLPVARQEAPTLAESPVGSLLHKSRSDICNVLSDSGP